MDLALERTRLLQRDAEWAAAASEGRDLELVLSFWTDDAVVLALVSRLSSARMRCVNTCRAAWKSPGSGSPGHPPTSPSHRMETSRTFSAEMKSRRTPRTARPVLLRVEQSRSGVEKPMANGVVPWTYGMRTRPPNAGASRASLI